MRRWFALGDPQTSLAKVLSILRGHGLLTAEDRLRDDVGLVSIGDHFDYGPAPSPEVGEEGLRILEWLAAHPREQVVVLCGNHDVSRVTELAYETDESFAEARALGVRWRAAHREGDDARIEALAAEFHARFPHVPTPEIAGRDYSSFTEEQRARVQALLLDRRMRFAVAGARDGREVLLTHAGIARRELALLERVDERSPTAIATMLNDFLDRAVGEVAEAWRMGERRPIDLAPLHVMGTRGREGGGVLYHRPAHPRRAGADRGWEFDALSPRRFDPRELPHGLVQACGHSGHRKCKKELDVDGWCDPAALSAESGRVRTLRVTPEGRVEYRAELVPASEDDATLYMIDGEIDLVDAGAYELLPLDSVCVE